MQIEQDPYIVLGVSPNASEDDIKRAYRQLAFRHHPDMNQMNQIASQIMQRINEAYAIVSDPVKRKEYDQEHGNLYKVPKLIKGSNVKVTPDSTSPYRKRTGTIDQQPIKDAFRFWYMVKFQTKGFTTVVRLPEEELETFQE
jgi:curved DNA-binding protein CbpA